MRELILISALFLAASPAAAQVAISLSQQGLGGQSGRVRSDPSPNDRRFLHRGNDRDILQRSQRSKRRWLRIGPVIDRRARIEQRIRNKRVCIGRR